MNSARQKIGVQHLLIELNHYSFAYNVSVASQCT